MAKNIKDTYENALVKLEAYRASEGLRDTSERKYVLISVCKQEGNFSTQDVFATLIDDKISIQTVYNCMDVYLLAGIIRRVPTFGGERLYTISDEEQRQE